MVFLATPTCILAFISPSGNSNCGRNCAELEWALEVDPEWDLKPLRVFPAALSCLCRLDRMPPPLWSCDISAPFMVGMVMHGDGICGAGSGLAKVKLSFEGSFWRWQSRRQICWFRSAILLSSHAHFSPMAARLYSQFLFSSSLL